MLNVLKSLILTGTESVAFEKILQVAGVTPLTRVTPSYSSVSPDFFTFLSSTILKQYFIFGH
jgi:hypothetical protein